MEKAGLREVLGDLKPLKEERQLKATIDETLENTLKKLHIIYENAAHEQVLYSWYHQYLAQNGQFYKKVSGLKLTPETIERFSQEIETDGGHDPSTTAGLLLTALVKASYEQGNNNFTIHTKHLTKKITGFGMALRGEDKRWLEITVVGDLGDLCACYGCVKLNVEGTIGSNFFRIRNNSDLRIFGKRAKLVNGQIEVTA